jgi:ABC-2 type transport system permease protein
MILVLLVGPGLISKDLRFNAIPLYFSKPLRRFDYFVGKLGVIAVYVGAVAISPALIAYVLGIAFSLDLSVVKDTIRILAASVAYGLVIVFSVGTLMLALSSLSRKSRYFGAMWLGLWLISSAVSAALTNALSSDWCPLISYTGNLEHIGATLLDQRSAVDQLTAESNQTGPTPPPMAPPQRPPGPSANVSRSRQRQTAGAQLTEPNPPWYWSAAVLAGLFGLSLCILTSRVKSLDRLK